VVIRGRRSAAGPAWIHQGRSGTAAWTAVTVVGDADRRLGRSSGAAPGMERRPGEDSAGDGAAETARAALIRRGWGGPAAGNEAAARPGTRIGSRDSVAGGRDVAAAG